MGSPPTRRAAPGPLIPRRASLHAVGHVPGELKAAFIFAAPESDPEKHRAVVETSVVELVVVEVKDYEQAAEVARKLVEEGVKVIELCAGFGHVGVAKVVEAVGGRVPVDLVRFDVHPGLDNKSGDELLYWRRT